jgi:phage terminase large subunit-like protein
VERVTGGQLPEFVRVVVAVDPSGSSDEDNRDNDAIGIVVTALGTDGIGYLLEDLTLKAGPATWGKIVVDAYERHEADMIVAEINYGGAMVREVIRSVKPNVAYKEVRASRGKVARADPISALVERGQFRLVGYFPELEEELGGFTTMGYVGGSSPNRADAMIWGASELFPGIVEKRREQRDTRRLIQVADNAFGF